MEHHGSIFEWLWTLHILPEWMPRVVPHSLAVILLLTLLSLMATSNIGRIPRGVQNFMEWAVEGLENFCVDTIGPDGRQYTPFVGTCFLYIVVMNLWGLIPLMMSPTSSLNTTIALGLCAIVFVHFYALKANGLKVWASHFVGEPLWLAPLMIPLHIVGELARPLSLSLRLYGNIFGEEMVIAILAGMSPWIIPHLVALPVQLPMMLFGVFTSFLQALVFSMLVAIYIKVTVGEHGGHDHGEAHESHFEDQGHGGHSEGDLLRDAVPV